MALEITQRCNLDCTLCYLSDSAEAIKDIPLAEVFRRIDMIRDWYGANTDVQVTGGDPTLRPREELIAIVKRIRERGLRPSLFTNGILASRELLMALAGAGLVDVAFHVDMTQKRQGYASELALNRVRREYIERTRGLGLSVLFNTTVFDDNFHELPALAQFFVAHSESVRFASFQLQADTGRGVLHQRGYAISSESVTAQLCAGMKATLNFDAASAGHSACNRFGIALVSNGRAYDAMHDVNYVKAFTHHTADLIFDRNDPRRCIRTVLERILSRPRFFVQSAQWAARMAWRMKADLWRARGRVRKLTIFVHNFMDASRLEVERIDACAFMVTTQEGPMSMCLHNAKRDRHVLKALPMLIGGVRKYWNPLTGKLDDREPQISTVHHTPKTARGQRRTGDGRQSGQAGGVMRLRMAGFAWGMVLALLAVTGCVSVPGPQAMPGLSQIMTAGDREQAEAAWARVLARYVDAGGRIDFEGLAANRTDLNHFVSLVYAVAPNNRPDLFRGPQDVLAYHINAYNALALYGVITAGIPDALSGTRKLWFFVLRQSRVGERSISLYSYENDVIRKLGDPRIHFALNCMVAGCPRLPREPFAGARLDQQLDSAARLFFSESRNFTLDTQSKVIRVSEILRFYADDFLAVEASLTRYLSRYRELPPHRGYLCDRICSL